MTEYRAELRETEERRTDFFLDASRTSMRATPDAASRVDTVKRVRTLEVATPFLIANCGPTVAAAIVGATTSVVGATVVATVVVVVVVVVVVISTGESGS